MRLRPQHWIHWLAVGLGSGLRRPAPGTWGTLGGVVAFLPVIYLPVSIACIWVVLGALVGPYICGRTARDLGCGDHGSIVWDEWAGVWIALLLAPVTWWGWLFAFALFRVFDIWKPWPIHRIEKLKPVGFGIMIDDLVAGLFAGVLVYGLGHWMQASFLWS